jgi:hypothetical protein
MIAWGVFGIDSRQAGGASHAGEEGGDCALLAKSTLKC